MSGATDTMIDGRFDSKETSISSLPYNAQRKEGISHKQFRVSLCVCLAVLPAICGTVLPKSPPFFLSLTISLARIIVLKDQTVTGGQILHVVDSFQSLLNPFSPEEEKNFTTT